MPLEHGGTGQPLLDAGHFHPGPGFTPAMQRDALGGKAWVRRRVVVQQLIEIERLGRGGLRLDLRRGAEQLHERLLRGPGKRLPSQGHRAEGAEAGQRPGDPEQQQPRPGPAADQAVQVMGQHPQAAVAAQALEVLQTPAVQRAARPDHQQQHHAQQADQDPPGEPAKQALVQVEEDVGCIYRRQLPASGRVQFQSALVG
ncbi:hypothetical protein D3C80_650950 [compost metagenome]